jgi:hypothetical protein
VVLVAPDGALKGVSIALEGVLMNAAVERNAIPIAGAVSGIAGLPLVARLCRLKR